MSTEDEEYFEFLRMSLPRGAYRKWQLLYAARAVLLTIGGILCLAGAWTYLSWLVELGNTR